MSLAIRLLARPGEVALEMGVQFRGGRLPRDLCAVIRVHNCHLPNGSMREVCEGCASKATDMGWSLHDLEVKHKVVEKNDWSTRRCASVPGIPRSVGALSVREARTIQGPVPGGGGLLYRR